jgi:zinc/manganese transport system substrate-binding protein
MKHGLAMIGLRVMLAAGAALFAGCCGAAEKLPVVATFSVIGDMVAAVGGDHVQLATLVGPGGDAELYNPTLADAKTVAEARIVFLNDINDEFEPWLEPLLARAGFKGSKVAVSRGARTLTSKEERDTGRQDAPEELDQHAWLDPQNGVIYVRNIAQALSKHDPANATDYRARAAAYVKELNAITAWAAAEMADISVSKRRAVASHDSLQYLAKALGVTLISVYGWTNKTEPSAAELARLARQIKQERVRALFLDSITDPRAIQRIAGETGAAIAGTLYGDALSPPGGEADTYLKMLRHDIATLKAGLLKN